LPDILAGSYQRYKEDQKIFTTCKLRTRPLCFNPANRCSPGLSNTAIAVGYKAPIERSSPQDASTPGPSSSKKKNRNGKGRQTAESSSSRTNGQQIRTEFLLVVSPQKTF